MNESRLQRWVELTRDPINPSRLIEFVATPRAGGVVLFLGTVREFTRSRRTLALDYDAYPDMALATLNELVDDAVLRWPLEKVAIVHRLGHLGLGETSVGVAVSCPHREQAFAAGRFLIDELKGRVPIWKQEHWDDGTSRWVHPGMDPLHPGDPPPADA